MNSKGKQVDYVFGRLGRQRKCTTRTISSEIIKSFGTAGLELTMTNLMENKKGNYVSSFFYSIN
jgi:hypothetical protein